MAEEKVAINLKAVEDALKAVLGQLNAIPNLGLNEHQKKYKALKIKQLNALIALTSTAVCPETWGVWPEEKQEAKEYPREYDEK